MDDFAEALMRIQDENFDDQQDALDAAQDFANDYDIKMYVLVDDERGCFWVNDQFDAGEEVVDEAIP